MTPRLILASASPRRKALLEQLDLPFIIVTADVDEGILTGESPADYVCRTAVKKAKRAARNLARETSETINLPILAADTTVVLDGRILGKPNDEAGAAEMLKRMSGRTHEVYSGVVVLHDGAEWKDLNVTRVTFARLERRWIEAYCASGEPLDKAGAYGVQGHAAQFIMHLDGSYSGVMGLPLYETMNLLRKTGLEVYPAETVASLT
ncbi:MAG TPA: nucleoside triphosphate pyrophosphatase [Xanthomonadales bacterium]|nr:nucleoside triphosphate pyrophosphatase [Xanthomonadales bacterium]